ncbi:MAG: DUF192 domain-containing protein [Myxococcales bacterium]|nr:DUF192 domain-containing protein [Myxococcales bacterium]
MIRRQLAEPALGPVELVDDRFETTRGLMCRDFMQADWGMLFFMESTRVQRFWMKNTLIPLDMIFADATGTVTLVHSNAVPGDETAIPGGGPVQFVLEINGGLARQLGIGAGSQMQHPAIAQDAAAWACAEQ